MSIRFQRGQLDSSGHYSGTSNGCAVQGVLVLLGIFATAVLIGWPFMVFHGAVAWLAEFAYIVVAVPVGLTLLARRASPGQHSRERP